MKTNFLLKYILILIVLVSACAPKNENAEVLKKLEAIDQKIDSLRATNQTQWADNKAVPLVTHAPGHIIDPPDGKALHGHEKMVLIELDQDIAGTNLKKGERIRGINTRGLTLRYKQQVYFVLAYEPDANNKPVRYIAFDICLDPTGDCHANIVR